MSTLVLGLRVASLLAFAGPMLLATGHRGESKTRPRRSGERAPLVANLVAFSLFLPSLVLFSVRPASSMALLFALSGCLLAMVRTLMQN
jgi:hypothetical protein